MKNDSTNIYRKSRESYITENNKCYTIEQAAAKIFVDSRTLSNYENGNTVPPPDALNKMSEIYNDPALRRYYCSKICEIGKKDHVFTRPKNLYSSGYKLINANEKLQEVRETLFKILADGKVDDDEFLVLNNDITKLIKEVKEILNEIEIEIERKEYMTK